MLRRPRGVHRLSRHFYPAIRRCTEVLHSLYRFAGVYGLLLLTACVSSPRASTPHSANADWHEFQGTWTAVGSRHILYLDAHRNASISSFSGSLMLAGRSRPNVGFRSEAIVFNDSVTGLIGRAIWIDERGDRVVSELRGEGTAENNKITGAFVGGTGSYFGATGTYEFSWRFILQDEDGSVQGESVGLRGRVRILPLITSTRRPRL